MSAYNNKTTIIQASRHEESGLVGRAYGVKRVWECEQHPKRKRRLLHTRRLKPIAVTRKCTSEIKKTDLKDRLKHVDLGQSRRSQSPREGTVETRNKNLGAPTICSVSWPTRTSTLRWCLGLWPRGWFGWMYEPRCLENASEETAQHIGCA
jgi:hypothetical protein